MIQDLGNHVLDNSWKTLEPSPEDPVILYENGQFTLAAPERFPLEKETEDGEVQYLFSLDGKPYFGLLHGSLKNGVEACAKTLGDFRKPSTLSKAERFAAITAGHLLAWREDHRICSRCGGPMVPKEDERALRCAQCGRTIYPRISPAVIVAVTDGDRLLMSCYAGRGPGRLVLLAGFCEIGETVEETVHREVFEETGVRVKNLRFYKSQPWGYSQSLLMGFFCELDGPDHLTVQKSELSEARWVPRDEVPEGETDFSLTGEMINAFRTGAF